LKVETQTEAVFADIITLYLADMRIILTRISQNGRKGVDWLQLVYDMNQWRVTVNKKLAFRVNDLQGISSLAGKFLIFKKIFFST
jgi:hypothetical protein